MRGSTVFAVAARQDARAISSVAQAREALALGLVLGRDEIRCQAATKHVMSRIN